MRLGGRVSSPIPVLHPLALDADQSKKTTAPINQRRHGRTLEELKQSLSRKKQLIYMKYIFGGSDHFFIELRIYGEPTCALKHPWG